MIVNIDLIITLNTNLSHKVSAVASCENILRNFEVLRNIVGLDVDLAIS